MDLDTIKNRKAVPNMHLRRAREERGLSQKELVEQLLALCEDEATLPAISEDYISRWERGIYAPSYFWRRKLCEYFGKELGELGLLEALDTLIHKPVVLKASAPQQGAHTDRKKLEPRHHVRNKNLLESNDCFSFGKLHLPWMVLDGEGTESYLPANIRTHYNLQPEKLLDEIERAREQIQEEQEENKRNGKPFQWNGDMYHLTRFVRSRESVNESMTLNLWFKPTTYYAFLAKNKCLKETNFQEKYILGHDWETPVSGIASTVAVCLTLVTSDKYTIFTQRGMDVGIRPGFFNTSVSEALSRPLDRSTTSQAPDLYRCTGRGLAEELGVYEPADFSSSDIHFLNFGLDTPYIQWSLCGVVKIQKTATEVIKTWQKGVKDKMENKKLYAIPFTPEDVCSFVFSYEPWAPVGLVCLYYALVHEFGREEVERVISSY